MDVHPASQEGRLQTSIIVFQPLLLGQDGLFERNARLQEMAGYVDELNDHGTRAGTQVERLQPGRTLASKLPVY